MKAEKQYPMTRFLQSIDDVTINNLMEYFQFEDYDLLLRYIRGLGSIKIIQKEKEEQAPSS